MYLAKNEQSYNENGRKKDLFPYETDHTPNLTIELMFVHREKVTVVYSCNYNH
jgi:hypothetical protein